MKTTLLILVMILLTGCGIESSPDSDRNQAQQSKELLAEADRRVGMPNIVNFQERKLMKMILELRDQEDFLTYTYIVNMHGELIYIGRSIGYGLPYSVQFTNPVRTVNTWRSNGFIEQLPQADPNGLFMPNGLSATWILLIDPETNESKPVYMEPELVVSPIKLH